MDPRSFNTLSLEDRENMPETRAQSAKRARISKAPRRPQPPESSSDSSSSDSSSESSSSGSESEDFIGNELIGNSGILYHMDDTLSRQSRISAVSGLTGQAAIRSCVAAPGNYQFRLKDDRNVQISAERVTCDCEEFKKSQSSCRHTFWLLDEIFAGWPDDKGPKRLMVKDESTASRVASVVARFDEDLARYANKRNWSHVYQQNTGEPIGDPTNKTSLNSQVRDVLAVFHEDKLPEELEIVPSSPVRASLSRCMRQGNLELTIALLAAHDIQILDCLHEVVGGTKGCLVSYADKIGDRIEKALADLNREINMLAAHHQLSARSITDKIHTCLQSVEELIEKLSSYCQQRNLMSEPVFAERLVRTLEWLVKFQPDVLVVVDNPALRPSQGTGTAKDRSLFAQSITTARKSDKALSFKILHLLDVIPDDEAFRSFGRSFEDMLLAAQVHLRIQSSEFETFIKAIQDLRARAPPPRNSPRR